MGRRVRAGPADHLPAPLHRPHGEGRRVRARGRGRGGHPGRGAAGAFERRATTGAARRPSPSPCATRPGPWTWSSSTSPGGPSSCRRGPRPSSGARSATTGARARWSTRWSTWWPGWTSPWWAGSAAPCGSCPSTRPRPRPGSPAGRSAPSWRRRSSGPASSSTRWPATWLRRAGPVGPHRGHAGHPRPRVDGRVAPARRRLIFDELFRLQLALVLRRRAFEHNARALRHDVSPPRDHRWRRAAPWWRASWRPCPSS